jgi:hypothetical protein
MGAGSARRLVKHLKNGNADCHLSPPLVVVRELPLPRELCHIGAVPNCVTLVPYRIVSHWCRTKLCHIGAVPNCVTLVPYRIVSHWCRTKFGPEDGDCMVQNFGVVLFRDEVKCVCMNSFSSVAQKFTCVTVTILRQLAVMSLICWTFTPYPIEDIPIHLFRRLLKGCNNRVPLVEDIPLCLKYINKIQLNMYSA